MYFGKGLARETIFMISDSGVGMGGGGGAGGPLPPNTIDGEALPPNTIDGEALPPQICTVLLKVRPSTKQLHVIAV